MKNKILIALIFVSSIATIFLLPAISQAAPSEISNNIPLGEENLVEILKDPMLSELDHYWNNTNDVLLTPRKGFTNIDINRNNNWEEGISQPAILEANTTYKLTLTYRLNETFLSSPYSTINVGFIDANTGVIANGMYLGITIPSNGMVSVWDTKSIYIHNDQTVDDDFYAGLTFKGVKNVDVSLVSIQKVVE